jgi:hypothetical protein
MNADVTPMNADEIGMMDSTGLVGNVAACNHEIFSCLIGVHRRDIGVHRRFQRFLLA